MIDFSGWTKATGNLEWGAQQAIHDSLTLASEGKISLVFGSDYVDGKPCLINSVGQMLAVGGGSGIPSKHFGSVVSNFDRLNGELEAKGVNTEHQHVSPHAAEILLHHFGELKPEPEFTMPDATASEPAAPYVEASDADLASSWLQAISSDNAPMEHDFGPDPETAPDSSFDPAYDVAHLAEPPC